MASRSTWRVAGLILVFLASGPRAPAAEKPPADEAVFELREVSVLDRAPSLRGVPVTRGQVADIAREPDPKVKAYPKLKSKTPLYGKVKFDYYPGMREGIEFRFVLDESGELPSSAGKEPAAKTAEESRLLKTLSEALLGSKAEPARPATAPPKRSSYDRLYFDLNRDLDLTNDLPVLAMKEPRWSILPQWTAREKQMFELMPVEFDFGPGLGKKPFRVLPWLMLSEGSKDPTLFFAAAVYREGRIAIGTPKYDVVLAQVYVLTGCFDRPFTNVSPVARPDGHRDQFLGQEGRRGQDALWLRRDLRVLVASAKGPQAGWR